MQSLDIAASWAPRLLALAVPGVLLVLLAFWGAVAVILDYHWRRYGPSVRATARFRICFYGVSLVCIATSAFSLITFFI